MIWLWIASVACLVGFISAAADVLCPVSRGVDYPRRGNHYYPLDVFFPDRQNDQNVSCAENQYLEHNYTCPINYIGCPLIKENLLDGLNVSNSWTKSSSLCKLDAFLRDKNSYSRFIVLGGSVTAGVESVGCCDRPECFIEPCWRCSWVRHLQRWLHSSSKANVTVYNIAKPGTTSIFSGTILYNLLRQNNLSNLTSHDVIFIDHSFNDNTLSVPVESIKLEKGLETLIRSLINMAVSLNDLPHIILLVTDTRVMGKPEDRYVSRYINIARHYGIRYYSFADALMSNKSITEQVGREYLVETHRGDDHPPWYVHLAYADLFAGLLMTEMNACKANDSSSGRAAASEVPYVMPVPVTPIEAIHQCKVNCPPLVKVSHADINSNATLGRFSVPLSHSWEVKLDRKKRGGIIIEVMPHSEYYILHDAPLDFSLGLTVDQYKNMSVMLQLQYMRSYTDSGMVSVFVCNSHVKDLDALWEDYERYRYTQQDAFTEILKPSLCDRRNGTDNVVLSVRYKVQGEPNKMKKMLPPRGNQLFKINSVLVCEFEPVKVY